MFHTPKTELRTEKEKPFSKILLQLSIPTSQSYFVLELEDHRRLRLCQRKVIVLLTLLKEFQEMNYYINQMKKQRAKLDFWSLGQVDL
ncbi:hypothetical protein QYF36_019648 [Acer negundo]|nr:hypothetical protein QYF36_019648 [Acer negundo]